MSRSAEAGWLLSRWFYYCLYFLKLNFVVKLSKILLYACENQDSQKDLND